MSERSIPPFYGLAALSRLLRGLEQADGNRMRQKELVSYFQHAAIEDAPWAVWLLSGERLKRVLPVAVLKTAAIRISGVPDWAFEECYQTVGDLAETIALLTGNDQVSKGSALQTLSLGAWIEDHILPLRGEDPAKAVDRVVSWWAELPADAIFCLNKLITGGFRVGVSRQMVAAALSTLTGLPREVMSTRLMHMVAHMPSAQSYRKLMDPSNNEDQGRLAAVPFFLAQSLVLPHSLSGYEPEAQSFLVRQLGPATNWAVEWKWDGIRAQVIAHQDAEVQIWSRGEEIVSPMFPELTSAIGRLTAHIGTDLVLDGEILVWMADQEVPAAFSALQSRLGRKKPSLKAQGTAPVIFMVYDLLKGFGQDLRMLPFQVRREALVRIYQQAIDEAGLTSFLKLSPVMRPHVWSDVIDLRERAQAQGAEGLMLKHVHSEYGQGRQKKTAYGECWKWKRDPFTVDAVLVYAQRGHGRRAGLYTDYGFALWDDRRAPPELVPFAKAYSGLTDEEIKQVDQLIRKTILEKFGPVRRVQPSLVMELAFEAVMVSKRHKSGYAVRFPRILRIRTDKTVDQADKLSVLSGLIAPGPQGGITQAVV